MSDMAQLKLTILFLRTIQYNRITVPIVREIRFMMMQARQVASLATKKHKIIIICYSLGIWNNKTETIIYMGTANFEEFQI